MDHKNHLRKYLALWQAAKANKETHGWEGWYVRRFNEDYYGVKPYTQQEAIAKAKELNNA
jgi:hypothetical protein